MRTATAILGLVAMILLSSVLPVLGAERAVLAEMYGATWCSNCPRSYEALHMHQQTRGGDDFVVLYFHVSDALTTVESQQRAATYGVSGVPHLEFDATHTLIGSYGTADTMYVYYDPYINDRAATATPITIETVGVVGETAGWVTATFRADDAVPYGTIRAQYVLYEDGVESLGKYYDWTVRDMLPYDDILLVDAGDSVAVTKNFTVDPAWARENMHVVVFVERIGTPKEIINAAIMPDPFGAQLSTDDYALEMDYLEESVYTVELSNSGTVADTFDVTISNDFPSNPYEWIGIFCDDSGACYFEGAVGTYELAPGASEILTVHVTDYVGTTAGMGLTYLTAASRGDANVSVTKTFATFVDAPSVVIIDDDAGASFETHLETALSDAGYDAFVYDAEAEGRPSLVDLASFGSVFWTTANGDADYISAADEDAMADYLDGGGNLFLGSMNFLSSRAGATTLTTDYMHLASWVADQSGFILDGVTGDAVTDGMAGLILSGPFPVDESDSFTLAAGADTIFTTGAGTKGLKVEEGGHKLVFMSSPFEDISTVAADPNNQKSLADRLMEWFVPPFTGVGDDPVPERHVLALDQNHPNPFNPVTTVQFTVPTDAGHVALKIHNVNGRVVRTLVDGNMAPGPKSVVWDGRDDSGRSVSSGIYFCRLEASGSSATRKMTLLK